MTPAGELLRLEIASGGPVSFRRFMEVALYHPEHGYYRRAPDPFGREGDFYTAEQVQPVFGMLLGRRVRELLEGLDGGPDLAVVEMGAGRAEMAPAFSGVRYLPVDVGRGSLPEHFRGVVFANEFFDALPVDLVRREEHGHRSVLVGWRDGEFRFVDGGAPDTETSEYLAAYLPQREDGTMIEVNLDALRWIDQIGRRMGRGWLMAIDYGYTARESVRFPQGTLMSYRRHRATEDVLRNPGEQDITAHVNFTALEQHAAKRGFRAVRFESMARTLLDAGEKDQFAEALAGSDERERMKRRLQLKTLLFGMGETFRTLLLQK